VLAILGTVPDETFPLVDGPALLDDGNRLVCDGRDIPVLRGTPALLAAAVMAARHLGQPSPRAILAGDIGTGQGSRAVYAHLAGLPGTDRPDLLVFHYLLPDVDWHDRLLLAIEAWPRRPRLVADAGYMYAAKMSGQAPAYDLFTPDVGELAFLADEQAPHPFYTRGFLLQEEANVPGFIERAYRHGNAARYLLVKGRQDAVADATGILETVGEPACPAMEAIGGTGDTLTGLVAGLLWSGMDIRRAAVLAARVNRLAGALCRPTPATQIAELVRRIPQALGQACNMAR
jgi:ADP-dependent NAD(P)H-hydrate dehydratase / NAD(P)H-hydrate epimerase